MMLHQIKTDLHYVWHMICNVHYTRSADYVEAVHPPEILFVYQIKKVDVCTYTNTHIYISGAANMLLKGRIEKFCFIDF